MRRILLTFGLITIYLITYSQITFNKLESYGLPSTNAYNIKRIADNYYIQYIYLDSIHKQGMSILKTDEYGNVIKEAKFIDTAYWYGTRHFNNVIASSDSFLIVVANRYYYQQLQKEMIEIWKFDTNLDTIWTRLIEHPDTFEANLPGAERLVRIWGIVEALDGGYVLSVNYNRKCMDPTNTHNYRALLMKIDTAGDVQWVNKNNEMFVQLIEIKATSDSGFFSPATITNLPYKLNKFDKHGNYQWSVAANNHSTQTHYITSCEYDSVSAIMATYYKLSTQIGELGVSVSKINTITKTVEWNKDFIIAENMASNVYLYNLPMNIRVDNNGGIFIATSGRHLDFTPPPWVYSVHITNGIVLKLNNNGDSLWTKYYGFGTVGDYNTELQDFMILDDGSFVGVGFGMLIANPQMKFWFFKTNPSGYLGFDDKEIQQPDKLIRLYPNPAKDFITIEFKKEVQKELSIEIYDLLGKEVKHIELPKGIKSHKLSLKGLPSGVYFYQLISANGVLDSGKFVVK